MLNGTEPNDIANARVRLFVTVGHTHTTANCDIKAFQFTIFVHDSDEAKVIGKDVDIVVRGDGDCNFELDGTLNFWPIPITGGNIRTFRGR